jgi:predicted cupin superfamily sugar epimerase
MFGRKKEEPAAASSLVPWEQIVSTYMMEPHPKGGYYREVYRSKKAIPAAALAATGHQGDRPFSTAILYLLPAGAATTLNRLKSDEVLHLYMGGPLTLVKISPSGLFVEVTLGQNIAAGEQIVHVVEAGWWFGSYCNPGAPYALIGCTVAPGFDFQDFEIPNQAKLIQDFPQAKALIERFAARPQKPA